MMRARPFTRAARSRGGLNDVLEPAKIEVFYKQYGRRKWRGEEISTEAGWVNQQEKAYRANPTQRDIDKIRAFCGADGCDPRVIGGGLDGVIADLSK